MAFGDLTVDQQEQLLQISRDRTIAFRSRLAGRSASDGPFCARRITVLADRPGRSRAARWIAERASDHSGPQPGFIRTAVPENLKWSRWCLQLPEAEGFFND